MTATQRLQQRKLHRLHQIIQVMVIGITQQKHHTFRILKHQQKLLLRRQLRLLQKLLQHSTSILGLMLPKLQLKELRLKMLGTKK